MKITKIDVIPISIGVRLPGLLYGPLRSSKREVAVHVIVKIHTDEGIIGFGESTPNRGEEGEGMNLEMSAPAIIKLINQWASVLLGADPFQIGPLFRDMEKVTKGCLWAKAGIDIALFDLMGKACKKPISSLLGGTFRDKLPVEFPLTDVRCDPTRSGEEAADAVKLGYRFIEIKAGIDPNLDVERVRAVRNAIGNKPSLKVDINEGYENADIAIKTIKRMEKFDIDFVEQPLKSSDVKGMSKITEAVETKIVADEIAASLPALVENVIRKKAADAVHIKTAKGGFAHTMKMITVAEAAGIIPIVGAAYSFGIGIAAVHQVAASMIELQRPDHYGLPFYVDDILTSQILETNGYVKVSRKPGLGVEIDECKLEILRTSES